MKTVIIDADTGIDDSVAILYALKSRNIRVVGITTCFGNNTAKQAAENTIRLIKLANCDYEVPVVAGAEESIDGVFASAPAYIHGENGIGNVELPDSEQKVLPENASDFIIRKANELNGELTVITLGRFTNLACAVQKDPTLIHKIKNVVSMGGNFREPGNASSFAEANIYGDARAADIVIGAGFHMILVGLDVTMKTFVTEAELKNTYENCRDDCRGIAAYLLQVQKLYFEFHRASLGMVHSSVVHDPLAMLIAEDPSLGTYIAMRAHVEYDSEKFMGMLIRDSGFIPNMDRDEIFFCKEVDSDKAVRRLLSNFQDNTFGKYNSNKNK